MIRCGVGVRREHVVIMTEGGQREVCVLFAMW